MIRTVLLFACLVTIEGAARAVEIPRIDRTYPPPVDARRPDRTIAKLEGGPPALLAYSPDGRTVATGGADKVVRLWSARTGEDLTGGLVRAFEGEGAGGKIAALGFTPDGATLLAVAGDSVTAWEVATGKTLRTTALKAAVTRPVFRPGKEPLLAGAVGDRVGLWSHETGELVRWFEAKDRADGKLRALAFRPDGKALLVGTDKGAVLSWDVDSGALGDAVTAGAGVRTLAATATQVVVGLPSGEVKVWTDLKKAPRAFSVGRAFDQLALSAKGEQLAVIRGNAIAVWDVETGKLLCTQEGHTAAPVAVAFNPNGQKIASAGLDRSLRIWTVPLPPIAPDDLETMTAALPAAATAKPKKPRKLLVIWRADAILHKGGVPAANKAIELMGKKTGAFEAHFSRDPEAFSPKVLKKYDAIVMNSTAHLVLNDDQKKALLDYVNGGGGVIGIHAAIDMFKGWPEGAKIVGATFASHPWHPSGTWSVKLEEPQHPLLRAFGGKDFKMHDEFYELGEPYTRADRKVLMKLDIADPATLAVTPLHRADKDFAVSWIKDFGRGRVFYCMFGHLADPFQIPPVLQYYLDGIQYVLGDLELPAPRM